MTEFELIFPVTTQIIIFGAPVKLSIIHVHQS